MSALLIAIGAFVGFVAVHVIVWRLHRPRTQYVTLGALWLAVLVGALGIAHLTLPRGDVPALHGVDYANLVMLYVALALPYFTTYSAVQADSPAMTVLLRIDRAGPAGVSPQELRRRIDNQHLVLPRVDDLLRAGLISRDGERLVVGSRGVWMAGVHVWFRALLRMEKGG